MDESRERGVYTPSRSRRHWGAPFWIMVTTRVRSFEQTTRENR